MVLNKNMKIFSVIYWSVLLLFFVSCSNEGTNKTKLNIPDSVKTNKNNVFKELSKEVIDDLVQNISSPIEMADLIRKAGVPFSKSYMTNPDLIENYNTEFSKSINLGVLGADLGYLNIYNKTSYILDYLTSIKAVSEDLRVGQFFDFSLLKRLSSNNENLDSLMLISVSSFNRMDNYLRENKRSDASVLMVTGVWIESLYLATEVSANVKDNQINERIALQKISLNDLILVLKVYKEKSGFSQLISDFEELKAVYDPIKINVEKGEPTTKEEDGILIIVQNDIQKVTIPEGQMEKIREIVKKVRNNIIGLKS